MLNKDKVRGILRAKQGSQIPKLYGGGMMDDGNINYLYRNPIYDPSLENPYLKGNPVPTPGIPGKNPEELTTITNNPIGDLRLQELELAKQAILNTTNNLKRQLRLARGLARGTYMVSNGEVVLDGKLAIKNSGAAIGNFAKDNANILGNAAKGLVKGIGNFAKNNPNIMGAGLDALGGLFNKGVTNNKGTLAIFGIGDTVANGLMAINPVAGLVGKGVMTAVKGINNIFGKKTKDFSVDTKTIEEIGGSYGGSVADINEAASKANKKYGLFSSGSRRKANRLIDSADLLLDIMSDIADDARDQRAMINDYNYLRYDNTLMGGYDQRYMRAAKSGMKLLNKIDFIKLKHVVNSIINLDTKTIEWEPEVIIFKTGGTITQDWNIVFELPKEIIECKDGGKTKKELETPEIEETSQKNIIPEGALHKNKHHIEHTEGLTLKGIPVIDNDGEQQAEIELNEIIFTLEVTKKLEELYKEGTNEAAIEAGKLLVKEILFNTDDRTGLIAKCLEGGKL